MKKKSIEELREISGKPPMKINEEKYKKEFGINVKEKDKNGNKQEKALEHALEVRKFEIELYWKRATYFWTFIAATFAGYFLVLTRAGKEVNEPLLYISSLGFIFSFGWYCVNRGSKYWQENWENHVSLLED